MHLILHDNVFDITR